MWMTGKDRKTPSCLAVNILKAVLPYTLLLWTLHMSYDNLPPTLDIAYVL